MREYLPSRRVVVRRNPFYGGDRAHHVDGFDVDLSAGSPEEVLDRVEAGKADWGYAPAHAHTNPGRELIRKYGLNESRYFINRGLTMAMFVLNSSGPLFKDNPRLRRAVNLALDRNLFKASASADSVTDQYLPSSVQGFRDRAVYPLGGDMASAKALAAGNLRDRKAVFYVPDCAGAIACAAYVARQLEEKLGLEFEVKPFPEWTTTSAYLGRLGDPDEPWDLALIQWTPDFVDPFAYINRLLDARAAGGTDLAHFDEPLYRDLMRKASRLQGAARDRAYAELDLRLARDAAPVVPIYVVSEATLVSKRVPKRCLLLRPSLVLTTVCLKR